MWRGGGGGGGSNLAGTDVTVLVKHVDAMLRCCVSQYVQNPSPSRYWFTGVCCLGMRVRLGFSSGGLGIGRGLGIGFGVCAPRVCLG